MASSSVVSRGGGPATGRGALADFAVSAGELRASAANLPVDLDEPDVLWFVGRGALDISLAEFAGDRIRSPFKHVLRIGPGCLAFGVDALATDSGLKIVGKGLADTQLYRIALRRMLDEAAQDTGATSLKQALAAEVDSWIEGFADAVARDVSPRPIPSLRIESGRDAGVPTAGIVTAHRSVVWLQGETSRAAFLEVEEGGADGPGLMPVTPGSWVELHDAQGITCVSSHELDVETLLRHGLAEFHRLALRAEAIHRRLLLADEANLQVAHFSQRRRDEIEARRSLANLSAARTDVPASGGHALTLALQAVGRREGISIVAPALGSDRAPTLPEILQASGIRARRVRLTAEDRWWLGDSGSMLAFRRSDGHPLALLPGAGGRYRLLDPVSGRSARAGPETAAEVHEDAWLPYRTLPHHRPIGMRDLFAVAGGNVAADVIRLAVAGVAAGILTLAPAVAVNILTGSVLPSGDPAALAQLCAMLVAIAIVATLSHMFRGTALMRLEGRAVARMTAAVWDRMLRLRPEFYRGFTAGDLAARAMVFHILRDRVSGAVADALLSTLFLLPMFALLFYYDTALGWLTLGFGLVALTVMSILARLLVEPHRRYFDALRRLCGDLLQFIDSIDKLRSTGAEGSAFAAWARRYREQKRAQMRIAVTTEHVTAFTAALPALAGAALFAIALGQDSARLAPADFLAVYTATIVFYMAVARLGESLQAVASIVPGAEQVRPVLAAETDSVSRGQAVVTLQGEVAFHQVSFRYSEQGPMVLKNVSLHARPGELVAIVGESGVGKSTLFRIALGLVDPVAGAVYFDGKDLSHLDRDVVRRQIGVVTQDGSLRGGNVLNNIIGVTNALTIDDAWRAARQASVDRDIRSLPMGMFTTVGEGASTFSGGQQQRIRIAAALVHNPRIILLDEPTSWLDTKSQAETMEGIEGAVGTRIVIAHRLSTIRKANRIYVLQAGSVVQVGKFEELLEQDGPFRDLAQRQMLS